MKTRTSYITRLNPVTGWPSFGRCVHSTDRRPEGVLILSLDGQVLDNYGNDHNGDNIRLNPVTGWPSFRQRRGNKGRATYGVLILLLDGQVLDNIHSTSIATVFQVLILLLDGQVLDAHLLPLWSKRSSLNPVTGWPSFRQAEWMQTIFKRKS